jgi:RNA polymerase primary sigma factor
MTVAELQEFEEIRDLVAKGVRAGVLSDGEIQRAVAELEIDDSDVERLYGLLEVSQIELVDEIDPAIVAGSRVGRTPDRRCRRPPTAAFEPAVDGSSDSLALFLREIRKLRLLTGGEEVDLAKRIERGDLMAKQRWLSPICGLSCRSRRATVTRACRSWI